jgi:hypothetical protein
MMAPSIKLNGSNYKEWKLLTMDYLHLMDYRDHALGMVKPPRPLIISRIPITITQSLSSTTPPVTGDDESQLIQEQKTWDVTPSPTIAMPSTASFAFSAWNT